MKAKLLQSTVLWTFLSVATLLVGCSDDEDYRDVDGQSPTLELTSDHIRTLTGYEFKIAGKIVDKDGYTIYEEKIKPKRVVSYENAFLMTELLKGGITEPGGTSRALWNFDLMRWDTEFGGKTGTSSNYSDAWYIGITPKLVGGAWVGAEHRSVHFRSGSMGQGSRTALPVFALFMEKVLSDNKLSNYRAKFPAEPKQTITRDYKCQSYYKPDTTVVDSTEVEPVESLPIPELDLGTETEKTTPVLP